MPINSAQPTQISNRNFSPLRSASIQDNVMLHLHNKAALDSSSKDDIVRTLLLKGTVNIAGTEVEKRTIAVGIQKIYEEELFDILDKNPSYTLKMVSHTAMPPTPLCVAAEAVDTAMHPDIKSNQASQKTITDRATTLKNLLSIPRQFSYAAIYDKPRDDVDQQVNFDQAVATWPNLFAVQTEQEGGAQALTGATYYLSDEKGKTHVFGIRISQANKPSDEQVQLFQGLLASHNVENKLAPLNHLLVNNTHNVPHSF